MPVEAEVTGRCILFLLLLVAAPIFSAAADDAPPASHHPPPEVFHCRDGTPNPPGEPSLPQSTPPSASDCEYVQNRDSDERVTGAIVQCPLAQKALGITKCVVNNRGGWSCCRPHPDDEFR